MIQVDEICDVIERERVAYKAELGTKYNPKQPASKTLVIQFGDDVITVKFHYSRTEKFGLPTQRLTSRMKLNDEPIKQNALFDYIAQFSSIPNSK